MTRRLFGSDDEVAAKLPPVDHATAATMDPARPVPAITWMVSGECVMPPENHACRTGEEVDVTTHDGATSYVFIRPKTARKKGG